MYLLYALRACWPDESETAAASDYWCEHVLPHLSSSLLSLKHRARCLALDPLSAQICAGGWESLAWGPLVSTRVHSRLAIRISSRPQRLVPWQIVHFSLHAPSKHRNRCQLPSSYSDINCDIAVYNTRHHPNHPSFTPAAPVLLSAARLHPGKSAHAN